MGSVTSAFTRTRNALVKVGSEPDHNDTAAAAARGCSAPDSDRVKKRSARSNVTSSQAGRQSTRPPLSEVLAPPDGDGPRPPSKSSHCELRWVTYYTHFGSQMCCSLNKLLLLFASAPLAKGYHIFGLVMNSVLNVLCLNMPKLEKYNEIANPTRLRSTLSSPFPLMSTRGAFQH